MNLLRTKESRFNQLKDYPFKSHYSDIEGIRIHYLDVGPGDAPVILLLHGVPSWSYLYREMIPILANAEFRVIAPDIAGFGKSDKPTGRDWHSLSNHSDIIGKLTKDLNLKNVFLFGQDWGSMIGLRVAMSDMDRYSGIIISNGGLPNGKEKKPLTFKLWMLFSKFSPWLPIDLIINAGSIKKLSKEEKKAYRAPFPKAKYKTGPRILPVKVPIRIKDKEAKLNVLAWEKLSKWEKPFLTIFGDSDPITKGWDKKFQSIIPGAFNQNHQTLNAGHFIQEDAGLALAEIIITFIRDNTINNSINNKL